MNAQNVVLLTKHKTKELRNYLIYLKKKGEFVICSHFETDGETVDWDWGHYYNDLLSAVMDFYKDDLNEKYDFENIFVMLNELDYGINGEKRELTEKEKKMVNNFSDFYNFLENNKEF